MEEQTNDVKVSVRQLSQITGIGEPSIRYAVTMGYVAYEQVGCHTWICLADVERSNFLRRRLKRPLPAKSEIAVSVKERGENKRGEMTKLYMSGMSMSDVAKIYGISRQRVHQVVHQCLTSEEQTLRRSLALKEVQQIRPSSPFNPLTWSFSAATFGTK